MSTEDTTPVSSEMAVELAPEAPVVAQREFLTEADKHHMELIKMRMSLAVANADLARLNYDKMVLQFTLRYGLKADDIITEDGEIRRGKV